MLRKNPPKFKPYRKRTVSFGFPNWDFKLLGLIFFFFVSVISVIVLGVVFYEDSSLKVSLDDVRSLGSSDAPVVVVKYSDFRCGFCGRFASETKPLIESEYIDSGKVRFVYKDFAVLGPDSVLASAGGWCAHDQNKFWKFHDTLFNTPNNQDVYSDFLSHVAGIAGLDVSRFESCLSGGSKNSLVDADSSEASSNGFRGTPSFIVMSSDGSIKKTINGAEPFSKFKMVIDSLLN